MTVIPSTSPDPQTCYRCITLGLPELSVPPLELFYIIAHENSTLVCCEDCFARLWEEIQD